jgi:hypothetical protein
MIKMILEDIDDEITYENKNTLSYIEQYSKNQINKDPETLTEVRLKIFFEDCWIHPTYEALLHELHQGYFEGFKLISAELSDPVTNTLVAGEIGYLCNGLYTGLTKFSLKEKAYSNWGTLQRVLLTQHLDTEGIHLSNLGHPQMQYKLDLGATIYDRKDFLKKCNMLWVTGLLDTSYL